MSSHTKTLPRASFGDWVQAARLKFLPQGIMPVIIAAALGFKDGVFDLLFFFIAFVAAAAVQIGLTMLNDTLDYAYGTDKKAGSEKNPFSGGSGVLASGIIKPKQALSVIFLLYLLALFCLIYMAFQVGSDIIWVAVIGAAVSIMYSVKPFQFAYRGIGELMMLIGYGPIVTSWGYLVYGAGFSADIFLIGIIPGILMWTMIIINEIPDYEEDRAANKKNITFRIGKKNAKNLYIASFFVLYAYIAALAAGGVLPAWCLISLLGIPLAVKAGLEAHKHYNDPLKVAASNKFMVIIYSFTTATVALGIFIEGLMN